MTATSDAEVYFGFGIPRALFLAARRLRWVHSAAAGVGSALYPEMVNIDLDAAKRVEQSLIAGGLLKPGASMSGLHDTSIAGS